MSATYATLKVLDFRSELCVPCGGMCCKAYAGAAWPEQFGAPDRAAMERRLLEALRSGKWAVDWWESYERGPGYFVRPAHKGAKGPRDPSWGGECVFLEKDGCLLTHSQRPIACRALRPHSSKDCTYPKGTLSDNGKYDAAAAWEPYCDVVDAVLEKLEVVKAR